MYCGAKTVLPAGKDYFGTRTECFRAGIGVGTNVIAPKIYAARVRAAELQAIANRQFGTQLGRTIEQIQSRQNLRDVISREQAAATRSAMANRQFGVQLGQTVANRQVAELIQRLQTTQTALDAAEREIEQDNRDLIAAEERLAEAQQAVGIVGTISATQIAALQTQVQEATQALQQAVEAKNAAEADLAQQVQAGRRVADAQTEAATAPLQRQIEDLEAELALAEEALGAQAEVEAGLKQELEDAQQALQQATQAQTEAEARLAQASSDEESELAQLKGALDQANLAKAEAEAQLQVLELEAQTFTPTKISAATNATRLRNIALDLGLGSIRKSSAITADLIINKLKQLGVPPSGTKEYPYSYPGPASAPKLKPKLKLPLAVPEDDEE